MESCEICDSIKVKAPCGICAIPLCKRCLVERIQDEFEYLREVPTFLQERFFCSPCYEDTVDPALREYDETKEKAKKVYFIPKTYRGFLPIVRKELKPMARLSVIDRDNLIQKLAYEAAARGFNAVIGGEIKREKVRHHAYEHSLYSGIGIPAEIDEERLKKEDLLDLMFR